MNTAMLLAARFNGPTVPLESISEEFLGIERKKALELARLGTLPFPATRLGRTQNAPWLVHVDDLGKALDDAFKEARAACTL
ncbi:hypothetical protein GCM10007907_20820 [Chitinimonas prasina]|uniref:Pyocin activator protein PrtN n=1 Tax=Chitinimonas prasina TaxID=1434937 RepID=A0ABQ5YE81_9NEIS|nr:pyocin activator PrtN family protein [Chitinimonas prasina]GLR13292.1 hypothetical protein GCM10007907_20820 [Chitinimonas prasina]